MKYLILLILLLFETQAYACGSTAQRFQGYWVIMDLEHKNKYLKNLSCSDPQRYSPRNADPIIAKVLADAIKSKVENKIINSVLKSYNCAYGARNLPEYSIIKKYITKEKYFSFCEVEKIKKHTLLIQKMESKSFIAPHTKH